jgi:hypothetical protein
MRGRRGIAAAGAFVAAGTVVLAAVAYEGVASTRELLRESAIELLDGTRTAYDCLTEGFRAAVPEGTRVLLKTPAPNDETYQRIVESTYPDYDFVTHRADADLVVHARFTNKCVPKIRITKVSQS